MNINFKIISLLALCLIPSVVFADDFPVKVDDKRVFNLVFENDIFAGTDQGYTNGVRFAWISSEKHSPEIVNKIARNLPHLDPNGKKRISFAFGQSMFAPKDLTQTALIVNDRPYAGWLYGSVGVVSDTGKTLDNAMLTVGVIGPLSLAEDAQKFIHKRLPSSTYPRGWANQLKNEPGIEFSYERKWRDIYEAKPFGFAVDAVPHLGVSLGNVNTNLSVGTTFRLGYDLPADYGPPRIRPSLPGSDFFVPTQKVGGYLFTTVEGRAVARNIFLDGNTFVSSHHVDKRNFVGSLQVGAALTYGDVRVSYTHVFMTKEFKQQDTATQFGAITFSYRF